MAAQTFGITACSSGVAQRHAVRPCMPLLAAVRPRTRPFRSSPQQSLRRRQLITFAKQNEGNSQLPGILAAANGVTSSIASFVPASIPRPVAKLGVLGIGSIITFWIFGKVISTLFTFALIAGAGYVFLKSRGGKSSTSSSDDGGDDSLAAARRIMDKYK